MRQYLIEATDLTAFIWQSTDKLIQVQIPYQVRINIGPFKPFSVIGQVRVCAWASILVQHGEVEIQFISLKHIKLYAKGQRIYILIYLVGFSLWMLGCQVDQEVGWFVCQSTMYLINEKMTGKKTKIIAITQVLNDMISFLQLSEM